VQHRIRELCEQLLATESAEQVQPIAEELQAAIHEHVENLRVSLVVLTVLPSETSKTAA
jgi:hypothetical protein